MTFNHHLRFPTIVLMLLMICPGNTEGRLIQRPTDVTAMVNHPAYFTCTTSKTPVDKLAIWWRFYPLGVGEENRKYIYDGGITTDYKGRIDIKINASSGAFSLEILQPQMKDAGRYECSDDDQERAEASAELTVLGSDFVCESNMDPEGLVGPNECDETITPDELQLSCSVTCIGNNIPEIDWRIKGNSMIPLNSTRVTNGTKLTCNATMKASQKLEGFISICQKGTQQCSHALKDIKVLYAYADTVKREYYTGDDVTCVANVSRQLPCSYQWFDDNMTEVSSNPALKPNDPGLYRCQAQCKMRNHNCVFEAMVINVSKAGQNVERIVLIVSGILNIGLIIGYIIRCNLLKAKQKLQKERNASKCLLSNELQEVTTNGSSKQKGTSSHKQNGDSPKRSSEWSLKQNGTSSDKQQTGSGYEPLDGLSKQKGVSFENQQTESDHKNQGTRLRRRKSERSRTT